MKIGIIGGAGPEASAFFVKQLVNIWQKKFHAVNDWEFPEIILHSVPFEDMLGSSFNEDKVKNQVHRSLSFLRGQKCDSIVIACQTLHHFVDDNFFGDDTIHLLKLLAKCCTEMSLQVSTEPISILASITSATEKIHVPYFSKNTIINYPQPELSQKFIMEILAGNTDRISLDQVLNRIGIKKGTVILGCTEFSLLKRSDTKQHCFPGKILDPLYLAAEQLAQKFSKTHIPKAST
ncbi:MAG: aspartate/glutamate racemase family protein [Myxococcales bacterium]|nr:aspartate/glutamate racemase family protein [Myxococcales bacterium]USN51222.1 MAG: aspartate/glutamate racemase family protein [Myxococcales bacterium]